MLGCYNYQSKRSAIVAKLLTKKLKGVDFPLLFVIRLRSSELLIFRFYIRHKYRRPFAE